MDDQEVVEQYQGVVRRYCRRRTWTTADAEDAAQAVLLRWVSRREREVANPEAWLLQAAKWACASLTTRRLHDEANRDTDGLQNAKTGAWRHDPQAIDPAPSSRRPRWSARCCDGFRSGIGSSSRRSIFTARPWINSADGSDVARRMRPVSPSELGNGREQSWGRWGCVGWVERMT